MGNVSQWNWKWIGGLVLAGIILFAAQRALTFDSRIQVLEAEKGFIIEQIKDVKEQLKDMRIQLDRIEKKVDRQK